MTLVFTKNEENVNVPTYVFPMKDKSNMDKYDDDTVQWTQFFFQLKCVDKWW